MSESFALAGHAADVGPRSLPIFVPGADVLTNQFENKNPALLRNPVPCIREKSSCLTLLNPA
jgi:hypothetical protein